MSQHWVLFRRTLAGLALIATLGVALLPEGQLPRVAGPCGRALCNCPVEVAPPCSLAPSERTNCKTCHGNFKVRSVLTLGASLFSGVDEPGMAFQVAFDAAIVAPHAVVMNMECDDANPLAAAPEFALKLATHDIVTPPPRA